MDHSKLAAGVFDRRAERYQEKFMDVGLYHNSLDLFCSYLPEQASVLELACGPGNITKYLLDQRPDIRILGTDLAPNMIRLAKTNNPTAAFQILDCRDIGELNETYNAVVCGFALPYLSREEAIHLIADIAKTLSNSGVLYLSTMEDDYNKSRPERSSNGDEVFVHYHEEGYLVGALDENGLETLHTQRISSPTNNGSATTDLVIIARRVL